MAIVRITVVRSGQTDRSSLKALKGLSARGLIESNRAFCKQFFSSQADVF